MRRLVLEATDINILNAIKNNEFDQRNDVGEFVISLDTIEGNMFISLDAKWGAGKTFYVRQVEKTLEYLTKKEWGADEQALIEEIEPYFKGTGLDTLTLQKSYLPVYYNAWQYDNHDDPLMSLLSVIVKKAESYLETSINQDAKEVIKNLFSSLSISVNIPGIQFGVDGSKLAEGGKCVDVLDSIKTAEEIREMVKKIFDKTIVEKAQRLVIFIDELDRCRPSFAIEMLERIKHYFDDDRIIFVASVNKEQLIHTISKYYGNGFDSTGYLNKFFDLCVHMPSVAKKFVDSQLFEEKLEDKFHFVQIAEELCEYYKLSLREILALKQALSKVSLNKVNDYSFEGCCLSLFIPIIMILDLKDEKEKRRFLEGKSDFLDTYVHIVSSMERLVIRFVDKDDNTFESGFNKFKKVYLHAFGNMPLTMSELYSLKVSANLKDICIKACNGFG